MSSGATPPRRFAVLHSSPASETELFAQLSAEHHQADGSDHAGSHATATLGHSPAVNRLPDQPAPPPIIAESDPYPRATLSAMLEMEEQGFRTPPVGSPLVAARHKTYEPAAHPKTGDWHALDTLCEDAERQRALEVFALGIVTLGIAAAVHQVRIGLRL